MKDELAATANLVADPGRAAILLSLMGGIALPAGELAQIANVAPQTASGHLARLIAGRLLAVERQGRHRYYRLCSTEVADAIESLLVLSPAPQSKKKAAVPATAGSLAYARTCYAHLAGIISPAPWERERITRRRATTAQRWISSCLRATKYSARCAVGRSSG